MQGSIWDAISEYTEACGGNTGAATVSRRRVLAVANVERAISSRDTEISAELTAACEAMIRHQAAIMEGKPSDADVEGFGTAWMAMQDIIAKIKPRDLAAEDAATRTPDSELDSSELEDQPEEVAKNRIREQWENK